MAVTSAQVQELYVAYLGRAADQSGLDYWLAELNAEQPALTLENLRANFVNEQAEYADIYGGLTREETVIEIYNNLFGRAPDADGLAYWTTGGGASVNADQLLVAFISGAAATDAQVVANKVLVSNIYTQVAGSNFSLADAAAAIAGVNATSTSVSDAIGKLTDLPSVAVPEAVAQVQAAAVAAKQVADFEKTQTNIDKLVALNEKVVALNNEADLGADLNPLDGADEDDKISFAEALTAQENAQAVRDAVMLEGGTATQSTAIFTTIASEAASELAAARTALVNGVTGALAAVRDFESAAAKAAASEEVDTAVVNLRTAQLQAAATTQDVKWDEAASKLSAANFVAIDGEASDDAITAEELYAFLSAESTTSTQVTAVTSAFSSFEGFSAVAELAAQAQANAKTMTAYGQARDKIANLIEGTDEAAVDTAYLNKFDTNADAQETLADAKAADALLSDIKAVVATYNSLTGAADKAAAALFGADAAVAIETGLGDDAVAEVFFFGSKATADTTTVGQVSGTNDLALSVSKGDSIYVGSGWTLNSSATFDAETDVITGGNNGAKEIFFVQTDTGVQAVIETADFGSAAAIADNANVAVITLTGVESLDNVSFANGMINIA